MHLLITAVEKLSVKSLSSGLGFYKLPSPLSNKKPHLPTSNDQINLPDFLLEDKWDFEDTNTYQKILSNLEKPWLGNTQNQNAGNDKTAHATLNPPAIAPEKSRVIIEKIPNHDLQQNEPNNKKSNGSNMHTLLPTKHPKSTESFIIPASVFSLKSIVVDAILAGTLFFPCLLLFIFLSEPEPLFILAAVKWPVIISFLLFSQVYCLLCRLFCAETYGEMLSRRRLCKATINRSPNKTANPSPLSITDTVVHPGFLFWRFLVSCVTGVILLPILSWCLKQDFLGKLTRLHFYETSFTSE